MTQEDKDLLLKDLCARLPYRVIVRIDYGDGTIVTREMGIGSFHDILFGNTKGKPYLRPMSSMTEEEKEELKQLSYEYLEEWTNAQTPIDKWKLDAKASSRKAEFYNSHHLDWNGLIPMNLALEVPEGMYKK